MPDVLSRTASRSSTAATGHAPAASNASSLEDRSGTDQATKDSFPASEPTEAAWTQTVSRETGGTVDGAEFRSIPVDAIVPNPRQPRQEFDEEHMDELIHSIREIGVLQPIVVRPAGPDQYELVMGERRWRASKTAERTSIPAIVRMTTDDDLLRDALLENIHRSQLNPLEEAAAYRQLLDDFNCTQDELAERIGRSRPQISNTLRLMKLPPAVQRRVAAGVLSAGHARALLGLKSLEQMDQLAGRIVAEGLSVRATEEAVTLAQRDQNTGDLGRERAKSPRVRQLEEFSEALTDRLDTQVKITLGAKKGRIAIDFGSIDDLHRLMDMIGSRP
ncbi:ParB/RepB/Spo0J family partition protein [Nesterenkonia sandarakina]